MQIWVRIINGREGIFNFFGFFFVGFVGVSLGGGRIGSEERKRLGEKRAHDDGNRN